MFHVKQTELLAFGLVCVSRETVMKRKHTSPLNIAPSDVLGFDLFHVKRAILYLRLVGFEAVSFD